MKELNGMKKILVSVAALSALFSFPSFAQIRAGGGQLSASFETNTIKYVEDSGLPGSTPDDRFGSNNYLNVF